MSSATNKLFVFDIDGTLTDSVTAHQSAFGKALRLLNCTGYSTDWSSYPHNTDLAIFKEIFESNRGRKT